MQSPKYILRALSTSYAIETGRMTLFANTAHEAQEAAITLLKGLGYVGDLRTERLPDGSTAIWLEDTSPSNVSL